MKLFTVASDSRIADLAVLLESVSRVGNHPLQVIPFDDNLDLTRELCAVYNAELCPVEPLWDALGGHVFGTSAHLERGADVQAWRYFRKFNALSLGAGDPLLFLDANSVLLTDPDVLLAAFKRPALVFGHFSKPGRNFSRFGKYLIDSLGLGRLRNHGYGAGFWFVPPGLLMPGMFEELLQHDSIHTLVGPAPEQGILNLVMALQGVESALLREVTDDLEYWMIPPNSDVTDQPCLAADGWVVTRNGERSERQLAVAKWTGNYHRGAFEFPQRTLHRNFVEAVLKRVAPCERLAQQLRQRYAGVYGHDLA